ncbi:MAG: hypothetical protein LBP69_04990 [Treponema sp.]|jgi:hypothetical protein|nr:hypothetical protein [Treponema sp.]
MPNGNKSGAGRYNKKIYTLAGAAGILALVYVLTLFFDPARVNARNAAFTWLSGEARDMADRIEISRPGEETLAMQRTNNKWFAILGGTQVPVKQGRIDDLFRILCTRGAFPRLGSSASSHGELGLSLENASRLVIKGGAAALPLLDLLVGDDDSAGREVYLRKNGENEYRSGDRLIKSYVSGAATAWYDLKLFAENRADAVQRIRVSPIKDGEGDEDFSFSRSENGWVWEGRIPTESQIPAESRIPVESIGEAADTYVRNIFDIQGDNFLSPEEGIEFNAGRLSIELGDGSVITILAAAERDGMYPVTVSGNPYVYLLSRPAVTRLLRERASLL